MLASPGRLRQQRHLSPHSAPPPETDFTPRLSCISHFLLEGPGKGRPPLGAGWWAGEIWVWARGGEGDRRRRVCCEYESVFTRLQRPSVTQGSSASETQSMLESPMSALCPRVSRK